MYRAASRILGLALLTVPLFGCPGDGDAPAGGESADARSAEAPSTEAQPAASPADPQALADLPPGVTAEMVNEGQRLFGTVCVACHGPAGTGTQLAPALNNQDWIHINGEYEEILEITRSGVMQPQEHPTPMPPMGGGNFDDEQLRAIAAYVYNISHGG